MAVPAAGKARANLDRFTDLAAEADHPIVIAAQLSSAVLVLEEDWQVIQETTWLLSIPGTRKSIRNATAEALAKGAKELTWQVGNPCTRNRQSLPCRKVAGALCSTRYRNRLRERASLNSGTTEPRIAAHFENARQNFDVRFAKWARPQLPA